LLVPSGRFHHMDQGLALRRRADLTGPESNARFA
jgi:hypothetical protein